MKMISYGKRGLITLLSVFFASGSLAENEVYVMNLSLTDGRMLQFDLATQEPTVSCYNGQMGIGYYDSSSGNYSYLSFERDLVNNLTFNNAVSIETVNAENGPIRFYWLSEKELKVSGMKQGDRLMVHSINGKKMPIRFTRQGSEAIVNLKDYACGTYIVSINKSFNFKIMIP